MWIFYKLILLGILLVCSIAAYYTLKEGFENIEQPYDKREGTCSKKELEAFNMMCSQLESPLSAKMPPIVKQMNEIQSSFQRVTALEANEAAMRIFTYINKNRRDSNKYGKVLNKFKCMFFTCDSIFKEPDDITKILADPPELFKSTPDEAQKELATSSKPRIVDAPSPAEGDAAFTKIMLYASRAHSSADIGDFLNFINKHYMKKGRFRTDIDYKELNKNYISLFQ
jgi:hypothetical protein